MIFKKITSGFVIQDYGTEKGEFINQEFIAGDSVDFEDDIGNSLDLDDPEVDKFINIYLPFDMVQPK